MPLYRYKCDTCHRVSDAYRTVEDRNRAPECHGPMSRIIMAPYVQGEIEPFKTVCWDAETKKPAVINSRAQKREFMKRNDLVEVGNEPFRQKKRDWSDSAPMVDVEELKKQGWIEESY